MYVSFNVCPLFFILLFYFLLVLYFRNVYLLAGLSVLSSIIFRYEFLSGTDEFQIMMW